MRGFVLLLLAFFGTFILTVAVWGFVTAPVGLPEGVGVVLGVVLGALVAWRVLQRQARAQDGRPR